MKPRTLSAERYLKLNRWLRSRYKNPDGSITVDIGGKPTLYERLDVAFYKAYILNP